MNANALKSFSAVVLALTVVVVFVVGGVPLRGQVRAATLTPDRTAGSSSIAIPAVRVLGSVRSPGDYSFIEGVTLGRLLSAAGGPTPAAAEIVLLRTLSTEDVPERTPRLRVFRVEWPFAESRTKDRRSSPDLRLRAGDVVNVTERDAVFVAGLVKSPGAYAIERRATVAQAIGLAGGATVADEEVLVRVLRTVPHTKQRKTELLPDLKDRVRVGDTVVVTDRVTEGLTPWDR
ncbi:MAG: SLBB domain-containing protein [Vicinamibacterales bacterium]